MRTIMGDEKIKLIRDRKIDIVRGIAIILMVLGHCWMAGQHFIYLFISYGRFFYY